MEMKTPCYIIDQEELEKGIELLKDSLQMYWNHYVIGYSFKTNSLPWVVEKMKKEGKAIIMISEELPELIGMSDRILIMKDGQITKEFTRSKDLTQEQIIEYMI